MQDDPGRYWQDLINNYRRMSDGELLALSARPEDLTEIAQQVLRDEIRLRNLDKIAPPRTPASPTRLPNQGYHQIVGGTFPGAYIPAESDGLNQEPNDDDKPTHEYTWKTLLCDCESNDHAWQLHEALKRHRIESWVRAVDPSSTDIAGPQLYVAADQLDLAQAIAAQPIPQDIIDDWNTVIPEFELPFCPRCRSREEVVLQTTEPTNAWLCETCGAEWTDVQPAADRNEEQDS